MPTRKSQLLAWLMLSAGAVFSVVYLRYVTSRVDDLSLSTAMWLLLGAKTSIELVAGFYGIAFLIGSVAFLLMRDDSPPLRVIPSDVRRVGLLYLCCDDLDLSALDSLATLSYEGPLHLVVHDDSQSPEMRAQVDAAVRRLRGLRAWDVTLLRRPVRTGGKAGAINYVLEHTSHTYDVFLLCDNDSTMTQTDIVEGALPRFSDPGTAVVQCRTVAVDDPAYCPVNRRLAESIPAFHAFLAPSSRFGWMPFVGHNAFLRTSAVRQVGGLTPDFFSDDLDLSVRLNLSGFAIAYAPELEVGEKHPPNYAAFRKRSYKWAYGCVQTLRAHWLKVLTSRRFSLAEKLSFFQFAGFYCLQSVLVGYLFFTLVALPLGVMGPLALDPWTSVFVGLTMVGLAYAPLTSYVLKSGRFRRGWVGTLVLCGLVYGGTDFSVVRGVADSITKRRRRWIPTNQVGASETDPTLFLEAACGLVLLLVPLTLSPTLLYLPCWYLFAGKFMFGPAFSRLYRDEIHSSAPPLRHLVPSDVTFPVSAVAHRSNDPVWSQNRQ